jgi:2-keto-4-pentenoate hydratase
MVAVALGGCATKGAECTISAADAGGWQGDFAGETYAAWSSGGVMPQLSRTYPEAMLADGYRVQEAFVARILENDGIGGYKAAVVGEGGQQALGIDGPVTGVVPASGVRRVQEGLVLYLDDIPNQAVETEIGYAFRTAITAEIGDASALREYVESVFVCIEIPGAASEEVPPVTAADLAARNVNAYMILVGDPHSPDTIDEDAVHLTLTHNGELINEGHGSQAAGGQWETLRKTVNDLVGRGYTIEPGHVITNGALGKILPLEAGHYHASYGELGAVEFHVAPSRSGQ